ncbi:MAG TPA: integrin alpha [Planctomycetota bacterium]|nr:integrin alpha [Planctomycetota bacterium]
MTRTITFAACSLLAPLATAQGTLLEHIPGSLAGDRLGWSLATPGDLDGDGIADVVVGVPFDPVDTVQKGSVQARRGSDGGLIYTLYGDAALDHAGWSLAALGDLDFDGRGDFAYGLPDSDLWTLDAGLVRVASGATGATLREFYGSAVGESYGHAVAGAGDVNGDGVPDVLVGAYRAAALGPVTGRAEVRSGATGGLIRSHAGTSAGDRFGIALCGLSDVDGDGRSDYAVGADQNGLGTGYVRVYSGATGALLRTHLGTTPLGRYGAALAGAGDADLDGRGDLAVGVPREIDGGGLRTGACELRSGASGALLWRAFGTTQNGDFGAALAGGADLDGDARADLLVGAPLQAAAGAVEVRSGLDGSLLREFPGAQGGDRFGNAVGWAGDLDGDLLPDLAIGAPREDPGGVDSGALYLYSGDGEGCQPQTFCTAKQNSQGCAAQMGWSGIPTLTGPDDFVVLATSVINQKPGVMIYGYATASIPYSNALLCVAPPLARSGLLLSGGNPPPDDCSGTLALPLSQAFMTQLGWSAGTHVVVQMWYRDPQITDGTGAALSNGLEFDLCP